MGAGGVGGEPQNVTTTSTYNYELKSGTTVKTYETRNYATEYNGVAREAFTSDAYKYTTKSISIPSSRAEGVMREQALIQTDLNPTSAL